MLLLLVVPFSDIVCIGHLGLLPLVVLLISWSLEILCKLVVVVITHGVTSTSQLGVSMGKSTVRFISALTILLEVLALHCSEIAVTLTTASAMLLLLEGIRWKGILHITEFLFTVSKRARITY